MLYTRPDERERERGTSKERIKLETFHMLEGWIHCKGILQNPLEFSFPVERLKTYILTGGPITVEGSTVH